MKEHIFSNKDCTLPLMVPPQCRSYEEFMKSCTCPSPTHVCISEKQKQKIIHDACKEEPSIRNCICSSCKEEFKRKEREHDLMKAEAKGFSEGYVAAKGGVEWVEECMRDEWIGYELKIGGDVTLYEFINKKKE